MTKHQPRFEEIPAADLLPSYNELHDLAIQSNLIRRSSEKFCPRGFLLVLLKSTITGKSTLEHMANDLGKMTQRPMSRSGMFQRFDEATKEFLVSVLHQVLDKKWHISEDTRASLPFNRLLIEDSTQLRLNPNNADEFPAHGNASGQTAGCKVDLCYDLLSSQPVDISLHLATAQDKDLGKDIVDLAEAGDCYLRDMGYYIGEDFRRIEEASAFWLSRLPANVKAFFNKTPNDTETLEQKLKKAKGNTLDLQMDIGKTNPRKARLVAIKADKTTVEKRRRERKIRENKLGKKSSKTQSIRDHWHIMVTNITEDNASVEQLGELYRLRWNIELNFKAWKQSGCMHIALSRKANDCYLESLILASMIRLALCFRALKSLVHVELLSMDKVFKRCSDWISDQVAAIELQPLFLDTRHIERDKRTRSALDDIFQNLIKTLA